MDEDNEPKYETPARRKPHPHKEKEDQLEKDFEPYNIPVEVKKRAAQIYMWVLNGDTFKRSRRKGMMCKCTYEAFKEHGIAKDPILLAQMFDITVKKLREAQDEFYSRIFGTEYNARFPKRHLTAKELLPDIATAMRINNPPVEELNVLIDKLYEDSIFISRTSPRDVAIAVLHWYGNLMKMKISLEKTQEKTMIARVKLVNILSLIEQLVK